MRPELQVKMINAINKLIDLIFDHGKEFYPAFNAAESVKKAIKAIITGAILLRPEEALKMILEAKSILEEVEE